jgi:WD40 repeat protein
MLVVAGDDSTIRIFNTKSNEKTELIGPALPVTSVDISPDLSRVIASSKDGNTYIFDLMTKTLINRVAFK